MRLRQNKIMNRVMRAFVVMTGAFFILGMGEKGGAEEGVPAGMAELGAETALGSEQYPDENFGLLAGCGGRRDRDYDGFTDEEERRVGTNPRDANSRPTLADNHDKISAWWPLVNNADEALEGELNGTLLNGAKFKQGTLELDGRRAYVNFGSSPALSFWGDFSYCLWLRPKDGKNFERVLGKVKSRSGESEYCLFIGYFGRIWSALSPDGSLDWDKALWTGTVLPVVKKNKWLHIGVSWRPDTDGVLMYVNGQRAWTWSIGFNGLTNIFLGGADLTLGAFDVQGAQAEDAFNGNIAGMIFCCETMSDLEMKEICLLGPGGDLIAYVNRDSDGDGLIDWWERKYFSDIRQNGLTDSDGDGLSNAQEQQLGTNPALADTDGDGYSDGEEIAAGSDPLDPKSTPAPKKVALQVNSVHGSCMPSVGTHEYSCGSTVVCYIAESPLIQGNTQYVSTGWIGAGSIPVSGTNLEVTAILQTNSAINWLWTTNYWLGLNAFEHGQVAGTSGWYRAGMVVNVGAMADEYWRFAGWSGDASGLDTNANPLSVLMDRGRNLRANFETTLPPDPADAAPAIRKGEAGILGRNISFLYSGENPIQTGADTNAFEVKRLAVVRGKILDREGQPLPGVTVTISDHPEYGQTLSRADGWYDLAVNGGAAVAVDYRKNGYLPARRTIDTAWQEFSILPEVRLISFDPVATPVQFGAGATNAQAARASAVMDQDGTRQATVVVPSGVQAYLVDDAGVTQAVNQLTMRFTEYTVGSNGPACMPAELPSSSFYTYCVELAADEAEGKAVKFDRPVSFYVDNFMGMPVGLNVPAAYYEWKGCPGWMAEPDGVVLQILAVNELGLAEIDLNGDGLAEDEAGLEEWGIAPEERSELAKLYAPGKSLWRVQVARFSPHDLNYPFYVVPEGAERPVVKVSEKSKKVAGESRQNTGGTIGIESGSFSEILPVSGTGYALNYTSARASGYNRFLTIPAAGADIPGLIKRVDIEVNVAGRQFVNSFPAQTGQEWNFEWDGKDAYGRDLTGKQKAAVKTGYVYDGYYGLTDRQNGGRTFGTMSGVNIPGGIRGRAEVAMRTEAEVKLGGADGRQWGLGGWMLGIHHAYDPVSQIISYGDGRESGEGTHAVLRCIRTVAGPGIAGYFGDGGPAMDAALNCPRDVCAGPDGAFYIADAGNNRIRKISPEGIITTVAGSGTAGYSGDEGLAINAELNNPASVAVCRHGVIYISDNGNNVIRKITPDGIIHTIAGTGIAGYSGDGGPAISAQLNAPLGIAVDRECAIYIADSGNYRMRRIGPNKRINTIAGTGEELEYWEEATGDGGPAIEATFRTPMDAAVADDGTVFVADLYDSRIRRIGNDGIITTVYQASDPGFGCRAVAAKPDSSSFYVVEYMTGMLVCPAMVWEVSPDGTAKRVAGIYDWSAPLGDGGPATAAYIDDAEGACFGPDGVLYIADTQQHRIRSVKVDYPGFSNEEIVIASEDGTEIYVFDAVGRHLRTLDAATRSTLYAFSYTSDGLLDKITDGGGLITTIERDSSNNPTAIVGPYGHRTEMKLDSNGWLTELTNPAGEKNLMSYTTNGLLTNVVSRRGYEFHQEYDAEGKIVGNTDPAGGRHCLFHEELTNGWVVAIADSLGWTNTHIVERFSDGTEIRRIIDPVGLEVTKTETSEGNVTINHPDGTQITMQQGPDPRFGMQSPIVKHREISTPSHFNVTDFERIAGLSGPYDPLSMTNMIEYLTVNDRTWMSQYTVADKTTINVTPMGKQSVVRTDALGRLVYLQSPGICAVNNEYDAQGRLVKTIQGDGSDVRAVNFTYAADGTLRSVNNALGEQVLTFSDKIGRLTNQVFTDGNALNLSYDRSSDPIKYLLPHGKEHGFGYNPVGLTERYSTPAVDSEPTNTSWHYNSARQMDYLIKPDGTIISNVYDNAGRLITMKAMKEGGSEEISYAYDEAGRIGSVTRAGDAIQYSYDAFLQTGETTPTGTILREYNDDFQVAVLSLAGVMGVSYAYDDDGLLTQAGDLSLTRDSASGFLTGTTLGNITDQRTYNGFGEVANYTVNVSGNPVYSVSYEYDALGRIINQSETIDSSTINKSYVYDTRGRLTQVTTNGVVSEFYSYDANGNRISSDVGAVPRTAIVDNQDRLLSYGDLFFGYSMNGEQTNRAVNGQTTSLAYDLFGQLSSVALPDGRIISYDKDALGRITAKRVNGTIIKGWIYKDGLKPMAETDASGNIISVFIYGSSPLTPDYMVKNGNTYRLIRDHVGSIRLVIDVVTGAIVQRLDYDSFGNVLQDTNSGFQPFGFQSGLCDSDTGFVQFGARWYDPLTGRWLSKDSLLLAAGWNVYAFVGNNPINLIDPWGLCEDMSQWQLYQPWIDGIHESWFGPESGINSIDEYAAFYFFGQAGVPKDLSIAFYQAAYGAFFVGSHTAMLMGSSVMVYGGIETGVNIWANTSTFAKWTILNATIRLTTGAGGKLQEPIRLPAPPPPGIERLWPF
ncbi:MAG: hypothetical protein PHP98_01745 [Kiritimatiellae bacterium]|nr:hypothetical protein [Kiritimatiellia bacterium]